MKKLAIYIVVSTFFFNFLGAQQLPIFTQYQETQAMTNPALLSSYYLKYDMNASANALYRYQWTKIEGAPRTGIANFEIFDDYKKLLIGGAISQDQTGPTGFMGFYGRIGYQIELNRDMFIIGALNIGGNQYRVKGDELYFLEEDDNANTSITKFAPDFALGAAWYYSPTNDKQFHFGLSIPQTFGLDLSFRDANNDFQISRVRHYYANGGASFEVDDDSWIDFNTWVKYVENAPLHFDINVRYEHQGVFWLGFGGSFPGALHFEAGANLLQGSVSDNRFLRIGYGFNYFYNTYGPFFGTAHEIKLTYAWWFDEF